MRTPAPLAVLAAAAIVLTACTTTAKQTGEPVSPTATPAGTSDVPTQGPQATDNSPADPNAAQHPAQSECGTLPYDEDRAEGNTNIQSFMGQPVPVDGPTVYAADHTTSTTFDQPVPLDLADHIEVVEGAHPDVVPTAAQPGLFGTIKLCGQQAVYHPTPGRWGIDKLRYCVTDTDGNIGCGYVTVTVNDPELVQLRQQISGDQPQLYHVPTHVVRAAYRNGATWDDVRTVQELGDSLWAENVLGSPEAVWQRLLAATACEGIGGMIAEEYTIGVEGLTFGLKGLATVNAENRLGMNGTSGLDPQAITDARTATIGQLQAAADLATVTAKSVMAAHEGKLGSALAREYAKYEIGGVVQQGAAAAGLEQVTKQDAGLVAAAVVAAVEDPSVLRNKSGLATAVLADACRVLASRTTAS